jgi:hypothetical protein
MEELCKILEEEEKERTERLEQHLGVTPTEFLCLGFKLEQLQYVMHALSYAVLAKSPSGASTKLPHPITLAILPPIPPNLLTTYATALATSCVTSDGFRAYTCLEL